MVDLSYYQATTLVTRLQISRKIREMMKLTAFLKKKIYVYTSDENNNLFSGKKREKQNPFFMRKNSCLQMKNFDDIYLLLNDAQRED